MSSTAHPSPNGERRFLPACAAASPLLILAVFIFFSLPGHQGFLGVFAAIAMTLMACSGPLLFVPVPCLAPIAGMVVMFVWILRLRTSPVGDWGWRVHLAISAVYVFGMFGVWAALERLW